MLKFIALKSLILSFAFNSYVNPSWNIPDHGDLQPLVVWSVEQMANWAPPGESGFKNAREEIEEAYPRYASIALDALRVSYDPEETPIFADSEFGRAKTYALLLAIASRESQFRKDVDFGIGDSSRGDSGTSWCLMQVQLGKPGRNGKTSTRITPSGNTYKYLRSTPDGFGGEDLVEDRQACFRVALHMVRESFQVCKHLPVDERLSLYTSGDCKRGRAASRTRVHRAIQWLKGSEPPMQDDNVMRLMHSAVDPSDIL